VPRKTRKQLVGKAEDVERAEREHRLAKLEKELHEKQERQAEATAAPDTQTPTGESEENS
jgi:hypothetical protein